MQLSAHTRTTALRTDQPWEWAHFLRFYGARRSKSCCTFEFCPKFSQPIYHAALRCSAIEKNLPWLHTFQRLSCVISSFCELSCLCCRTLTQPCSGTSSVHTVCASSAGTWSIAHSKYATSKDRRRVRSVSLGLVRALVKASKRKSQWRFLGVVRPYTPS